jgi:hypothetical protein
MINIMENLGTTRVQSCFTWHPPKLFTLRPSRLPRRTGVTPLFEPYEEELPLQSGHDSFVIGDEGQFRVKLGNTTSHGAMVDYRPVASAGNFRISRIGKLAEVRIISYDYGLFCRGPSDPVLAYTIGAFLAHRAFDASEHVIFHYKEKQYETSSVNRRSQPLSAEDIQEYLEILESEGLGGNVGNNLNPTQVRAFSGYQPTPPPRLHAMQPDQLVISIEEGDSILDFQPGPAHPRYSPDTQDLYSGKINFVIDESGWLILGPQGHHILSGGAEVGGAGHLIIGESGATSALHLNFSGHYRPRLTFDYVRYVFRTLVNHPLLSVDKSPEIWGRVFDDDGRSHVIEFLPADLLSDAPAADEALERMLM